ncbi:MAG: 5'-nucleotidase C-terminal domain-containing protein [Candidatus Nanopelagicales bacterium]
MTSKWVATATVIVIAGLIPAAGPAQAAEKDITVLGINDFHGRLLPNASSGEAGAAVLVGKIKALDNPSTVFAAAGDLIGASTFESFVQQDKPTIDIFNEAGLDVSAAGNHEFDQGYNDLVNRVMAPFDAVTNPYGGAQWQYLAANVRKKSDNSHALPDRWIEDVNGVKVGFVGAVTEELPTLVRPDGISDLAVTSIVTEVNASADALEAEGADVVIMLVHEGAATTNIASATDDSTFGQIVKGVDGSIDAIISGHTHLAYDHRIPVPQWQAEGRAVTARPVVSAGQYGVNINKLDLQVNVDPDSNPTTHDSQVTGITSAIVPLFNSAAEDPAAKAIVEAARTAADKLGSRKLGTLKNGFTRAFLSNGDENRGGESTIGNFVAEVYRWATADPTYGGAQIGFVNPGGMRTDMISKTGYPSDLTYKQAAAVQAFANTLVTMKMTGAQIKTLLEQQWQRTAQGTVPTRPFLRLGTSRGFSYTYDPTRPEGDRITTMWLNGTRITAETTYSVATNAFLAAGGDNFRAFLQATGKRDSGQVDLQATVAYAASESPLVADWTQHAIGLSVPVGAPSAYEYGQPLRLGVSSWAFSGPADLKDTAIEVRLGDTVLGTVPVDNTLGLSPDDEAGKATVDLAVPTDVRPGVRQVTLVGDVTGTRTTLPITVAKRTSVLTARPSTAALRYKQKGTSIAVSVNAAGDAPTGTVTALRGSQVLGAAELAGGTATVEVGRFATVGKQALTLKYTGDDTTKSATASVDLTVKKAQARIRVFGATKVPSSRRVQRVVTVANPGFTVQGSVRAKVIGTKRSDRQQLRAGSARLVLGKLAPGRYRVKYIYKGNATTARDTAVKVVRVRR